MGFLSDQFLNVVEWEEFRDDLLFWRWKNDEIKKGSKLIIRQGQDAVILYNGKVEGVFREEGSFDVESEIIPFLSTLNGFKFGFNSGMRAEVLFINTKEITVKWGTKKAIHIPTEGLPGGMPIRSFGTFNCKIVDHNILIEKIAGIKNQFSIEDVKVRVLSLLDQYLMKWISMEGKNLFNLQANSEAIGDGIQEDLDNELQEIGIGITGFAISSFNYPEEIQKMAEKAASQSMLENLQKYQQIAMADSLSKGGTMGNMASDMVGMQMGLVMGQQMVQQMNSTQQSQPDHQSHSNVQEKSSGQSQSAPKFCSECGTPTNGGKFCTECGKKLI